MSIKDFSTLLLLASIWGASFLFIRVAAPVVGPFMTTELRVIIAAVALLIYAMIIKYKPNIMSRWKGYLVLGTFNAAVPFVLISTAEIHISASLAAILNATTPLFTALVAWGWNKESLGITKMIGLIMGLFGVAILVGWGPVPLEARVLYSISFSLLAALSYAVTGIYTSRNFRDVKPLDIAIGQQLGASILLLPFALANLPQQMPSANVFYSILGLAILCTSFAYLLFFRLINNVGPVKTLSVTFLVPIFGIIWSVIFLNEHVYLNTCIGLITILLSILLVTNVLPLNSKMLSSRNSK